MLDITPQITNHDIVKQFLRDMPGKFNDVVAEAVNVAARRVKAAGVKVTPDFWNVQKDLVKQAWKVRKAKSGDPNPTAEAVVKGGMIGLYKFAPDPSAIMGGKTSGGVSVLIDGAKHQFKNAFVAQMKNGHKGIFQRDGRGRLGIHELFTSSIPQMTEDQKQNRIPPKLAEEAQQVFENAFVGGCASWLMAKGAK